MTMYQEHLWLETINSRRQLYDDDYNTTNKNGIEPVCFLLVTGKTKCDLCNKVLCNRSYFRKHLLHQHGIAENPYEDGEEIDLSQHQAQLMSHSVFDNQLEDKDEGSEEEDIEENVHALSHSVFD